jgi:hypothetical protein
MRYRAVLVGAASLLLIGSQVRAQTSDQPAEVHLRNQCRLAAQVLRTGHPEGRTAWALAVIGNCAEEGPPALVALWSEQSGDSIRAERVLDASSRLRDQRLADAAVQVARNDQNPESLRVAAILLLMRYADPYTGLAVPLLAPPPGWTPGQRVRLFLGGRGSHAIPQLTGAMPLADGFASNVIREFRSIAEHASSPRVQYVAAALAARLESDRASHSPGS